MSPLLSDQLDVFLGPHGVRAVRRRRGWRAVRETLFERPCLPDAAGSWVPCVEALGQALAEAGRLRARAFVTLSNHFVRYAVVPPVPGMRAGDRGVVAAHHMRSVYGEAADRWRVVLGGASARTSALAGAVEAELVPAIAAALRGAGVSPAAAEPLLVRAFNAARRGMHGDGAWLAVAEHGRLCVAALRGDAWAVVRSQRVSGAAAAALPGLLEQVRLSSDAPPPGPVHLSVWRGGAERFTVDPPWSIVPVAWNH